MSRPVVIGLLGLGTVGGGVCQTLYRNGLAITNQAQHPLRVKRILVRDLAKERAYAPPAGVLTNDVREIIDDPEIDIVVEVMGGVEPAEDYLMRAMEAGKHVVTANKELIAKSGRTLLEQADRCGVQFRFEAAVAGGIPIIRALKESLAANHVRSIMGIINGTTNHILTEMSRGGQEFATALASAQAAGYAEADPSSDVDGLDAAYKLAILASIAFGTRITIEDVFVEGIRNITSVDIGYAEELGYCIKLLAIGKDDGERVSVRVHPTMIAKNHPLASVNGVFNAIFVTGDAVGELMFYGRGAGDLPTGSAVLADVVDIAKHLGGGLPVQNCTCFYNKPVTPMDETLTRYFLRMDVMDEPGVLAQIAGSFGASQVSLASVIQEGRGTEPVSLVFVTHEVREANLQRALSTIRSLPAVFAINNVIRVEQ